ncbi:MAG: OB-fold domain-containing protein [Candidatus Coatesbacteria bacterium]
MVEFLRGRIVGTGAGWIVFDTGGVGLRVRVHEPARFRRLAGREIRLPVWLEVSPRRLELFGFLDDTERERFEVLIVIPGIGPVTALKLLPAWDTLANPSQARVPEIPGVGPAKTARIAKWLARRAGVRPAVAAKGEAELVKALRALGLPAAEAKERAVQAVAKAPAGTLEEWVRLATSRSGR